MGHRRGGAASRPNPSPVAEAVESTEVFWESAPAQPMAVSARDHRIPGATRRVVHPSRGKIIVALPASSLVDLSTFELNFKGCTNHGGNGSTWATTSGTGTNKHNYVNKRYFPRNTASLVENLEIKINGQSRQNINQYNSIYDILNDYSCGHDCTAKNRIEQNADPSNKTTYNN